MVQLAPKVAPRLTCVFNHVSLLFFNLDLGYLSLVKTHEGPQKTLSSKVTPSYILTLFCILTSFPIITFGPIQTFWPTVQSRPILLFLRM